MSRRANPTLIGIFVLGALVLGIIAVLLLAGGEWFQKRSRHILYFEEAAQGLQEGAPVVFLGVKIGSVKAIQLSLNDRDREFMVPVTIELEPLVIQSPAGEKIDMQDPATIRQLVDRGLRARLKLQNLLTGQQYVDLDFYNGKPARLVNDDPAVSEIPTIPTTLKELAAMLEEFPVTEFFADVQAISSSLRKVLTSEAAANIPVKLEATLTNLESLTEKLEQKGDPLLDEAKDRLTELRQAIEAVRDSMARVGTAADRVEEWAAEDSQIYRSITNAGNELAAAAETLQQLVEDQSPAVQRFNAALVEISRASRAVRLLAETLEKEPEALLHGKSDREE